MPISLRPSAVFPLPEFVNKEKLVAFNVGPDGSPYLLEALQPLDYRSPDGGFASFAKTKPTRKQDYRLTCLREDGLALDLTIRDEAFNIHDVQPLQDELILACGRSGYRGPKDFDLNGRVYSRDGRFLRAILLGDGIAAMQATTNGILWTSYYDEGVFGNFGWDMPVGSSGLVAWDPRGAKLYEFDPSGLADSIVDCYALNVASDDETWCYYYSSFTLAQIRQHQIVRAWKTPIRGSSAFAIAEGFALFFGAYGGDQLFRLVRLGNEEISIAQELCLCEIDGTPIKVEQIVGRADKLYGISESRVFQVDLGTLVARLAA